METIETTQDKRGTRWLVFLVTIATIAFNAFASYLLPGAQTEGEISNNYNSMFTPAAYTFSIWWLIYFTFFMYSVFQLSYNERFKPVYDKIAWPFIIMNLLSIAWIVSFRYEYLLTSGFIIVGMLVCGIIQFSIAKKAVRSHAYSRWLTVPFSLFLGWISVAVIAHMSLLLIANGTSGDRVLQTKCAMAMIIVSFLLSAIISLSFYDAVFPLAVSWAAYGISVKHYDINSELSAVAFIAGAILMLWSVLFAIYRHASYRNVIAEMKENIRKKSLSHR